MKFTALLASLIIGAFLIQDSEAWRYWGGRGGFGWGGRFGGLGWGGRFGGWGGWGLGRYGYGWGRPWGLYSPWYGAGYRYFRDTMSHGQIDQRVACSFISDKSLLVCQREDTGVECQVIANLTTSVPTKNYELFGIGNVWNFDVNTPVDLARFNLYPRVLDNSAWLNHTTVVGGHSISLNLFHSNTFVPTYYGFRVVEFKCYEKLVELFRSVPVTGYENITVVNEQGPACRASLFGEVLIKKINV